MIAKTEDLGIRPAVNGMGGAKMGADERREGLADAVRELITSYHDLNTPFIDELHSEPSPLEFMRYVARNRPFVIRKGAKDWEARKKWNAAYLADVMRGEMVNVAVTPHGNADSIIEEEDEELLFVKPYEIEEKFEDALHKIQEQERHPRGDTTPTRYLQTQNDNLRTEYAPLFSDCPPTIPFASIALSLPPDAINFWLGNSHSVTALHRDNYENIYVQVLGKKHFVLLPPVESACVNERRVVGARYARREREEGRNEEGEEGEEKLEDLVVCVDEPEELVPFATWDPDEPGKRATRFSGLSRALRVTLDEGDMLYLPALWYHKVSQSCSSEAICCAVNYWYDLEFSGSFWPLCGFTRSVGLLYSEETQKEVEKKSSSKQRESEDEEEVPQKDWWYYGMEVCHP